MYKGRIEMCVYIGIDISKAKLDISWLRDPVNNKIKTKVFKNDKQDMKKLEAWLIKNTIAEPQDILITLEPTGIYHENLAYFLHECGFQVFLANPGKATLSRSV